MRSASVSLLLVLVLTFIIVWGNFKGVDSVAEVLPHLSTLLEKESCTDEPCSISFENEHYDLAQIYSEELEGGFLLEILFTVKPQQINTKFFLTLEYRNADDRVVKMCEKEIVTIKGERDNCIEFILDKDELEKSEKIVT